MPTLNMSSILSRLDTACRAVFEDMGFPPEIAAVRESDRPDIAPFQCNGAMAAAGIAKKRGEKANPRDIAAKALAALETHPDIAAIDIAGPGFLNLHPAQDVTSARANALLADSKTGITSPLISELAEEQPDLPYFDVGFSGDYPNDSPVTMDDLSRLYPQASNKAKSDEARMEASRVATAELQAGRAGYRALLDHFIAVSVAALKVGYGNLGVEFDLWKGEACVDPLIPDMIAGFKSQGIAEEDDGALIVRVAREDEKKEMPPVMLLARSGAVLYHTTDLATLIDRKAENNPDLIVYVVDQRQALHFEQVFRAAVKAGWYREDQLIHTGFGTMNGKDGTPFKTREGGVLRLEDLIEIMNDAAEKRLADSGVGAEFDIEERADIARKIGLAALKFADLQNQRMTNYIFDPERFTAFEGKTGPYLLYAVVRIKSILRKAAAQNVVASEIIISQPTEQQLVFALDGFDKAVTQAADKFAPHIICDHVYRLAQAFSRFYTECPILVDGVDAKTQASRLSLAELTLKQMEIGLDILGIEAPERM